MAMHRRGVMASAGAAAVTLMLGASGSAAHAVSAATGRIWAHDNLFAWSVAGFDTVERTPEERAAMLRQLGFAGHAISGGASAALDREIAAAKANGIEVVGSSFASDANDPLAKRLLERFAFNTVRPWLAVVLPGETIPRSAEEWARYLPPGVKLPSGKEYYNTMSDADRATFRAALMNRYGADLPKTPEARRARLERETLKIKALAELAAPYGLKVALYNHNGWFGMIENQLAIVERLKDAGLTNVGLMYVFHHAKDDHHDDTVNFPALWEKMKAHVISIVVTGISGSDGAVLLPSQGVAELEMMRAIERSGWKGWVGLNAEHAGRADQTLRKAMIGLDWLAAELKQSGSGGPRPFAQAT